MNSALLSPWPLVRTSAMQIDLYIMHESLRQDIEIRQHIIMTDCPPFIGLSWLNVEPSCSRRYNGLPTQCYLSRLDHREAVLPGPSTFIIWYCLPDKSTNVIIFILIKKVSRLRVFQKLLEWQIRFQVVPLKSLNDIINSECIWVRVNTVWLFKRLWTKCLFLPE